MIIAAALAPAQAASSITIQHWGAYGTNDRQYDDQISPVTVTLPAPVTEVSSSNSTQYALLNNGAVWAWGLGAYGELGDGKKMDSLTTAVQVRFPPWVRIAFIPTDVMPYDTAFAVDTTGHVWGWGDNAGGELCLGNTREYDTPTELPFPLANVTSLNGGNNHATYDAGGTLYSCGGNTYGQLGDGSTTASTTPVRVDTSAFGGQAVSEVVASFGDTGALLANGEYFDWGYNATGQLGNGTIGPISKVPVQVPLPGAVTQVAQGGSNFTNGQTLAMLSSGALYAWGNDRSYQLGDGRTANEPSPEEIFPPGGVTYQTLASGGNTSYAISTTGDVWAWGSSGKGQLGDGRRAKAIQPVDIVSGEHLISTTSFDVVVSAGSG